MDIFSIFILFFYFLMVFIFLRPAFVYGCVSSSSFVILLSETTHLTGGAHFDRGLDGLCVCVLLRSMFTPIELSLLATHTSRQTKHTIARRPIVLERSTLGQLESIDRSFQNFSPSFFELIDLIDFFFTSAIICWLRRMSPKRCSCRLVLLLDVRLLFQP